MLTGAWERFLTERVALSRPTETVSTTGVANDAFTPVAADVPCNLQGNVGDLAMADGGVAVIERWTGVFLPGQDVRARDRLVREDGIKLEVVGVLPARGSGAVEWKKIALRRVPDQST